MTEYINKADAMETLMQMQWHDEDGYTVDDADEKRKFAEDWVNAMPTIDIVHCKDCKNWEIITIETTRGEIAHAGKCALTGWLCGEQGYCMYGREVE